MQAYLQDLCNKANYERDLGHFPAAFLEEACAAYRQRRVPDAGTNWIPTTRQLLDLAWPHLQGLKRIQRRVHRLLGRPLDAATAHQQGGRLSDVISRINAQVRAATENV